MDSLKLFVPSQNLIDRREEKAHWLRRVQPSRLLNVATLHNGSEYRNAAYVTGRRSGYVWVRLVSGPDTSRRRFVIDTGLEDVADPNRWLEDLAPIATNAGTVLGVRLYSPLSQEAQERIQWMQSDPASQS